MNNTQKFSSPTFEQALEDNLSLYTQESSSLNLFQTHREISIARYALSQQAFAYSRAIAIFTSFLDDALSSGAMNPKILTDIMQQIQAIENKSERLISSARSVTELLGRAVSIDVDKAKLSTLVIRLPSLIREVIEQSSCDPLLSEKIANDLDRKLSDLMQSLRFNQESFQPVNAEDEIPGITFQEFTSMHNSVPTSPTS